MTVTAEQIDEYCADTVAEYCSVLEPRYSNDVVYVEVRDGEFGYPRLGPRMASVLAQEVAEVPPTQIPVIFHEYHEAWEIEYWLKTVPREKVFVPPDP